MCGWLFLDAALVTAVGGFEWIFRGGMAGWSWNFCETFAEILGVWEMGISWLTCLDVLGGFNDTVKINNDFVENVSFKGSSGFDQKGQQKQTI